MSDRILPLLFSLVLVVFAGAQCSSDPGPACVPGAVSDCPCLNSPGGVQVCNAAGTGYEYCICPGPQIADTQTIADGFNDLLPSDAEQSDIAEENDSPSVDLIGADQSLADLPSDGTEPTDISGEYDSPSGDFWVDGGADICVPNCTGKNCGDDGCGGDCGSCPDDSNVCTDTVCMQGLCTHVGNNATCDDFDACTSDDVCDNGMCAGLESWHADCDDDLPCTDDSCDPVLGCLHTDNGLPCQDSLPPIKMTYDVVIVGAGSGGTMAAIQAARLGASVALLEETDWIGGQMTAAAVTSMDEGPANRESGLYKEFMDNIKAHYQALGKSIGTCYWSNNTYCFEPKVGRSILLQMVQGEAQLDLYLRMKPTAVPASYIAGHQRVTGVHAELAGNPVQPYEFTADIVIDATEWGDAIALSPAQYRAGNSTSQALNPTACVQDNTYTAVIRKYSGGPPANLVLSQVPPGYTAEVKSHFADIITSGGYHWLTGPNSYPADWLTHVGYRGMPDSAAAGSYTSSSPGFISRTGVNWANDYPYSVADLAVAVRHQKNCEAKLRTLQFMYYIQHSLGQTDWAIANDEGFDSSYNLETNVCDNIPTAFKEIEKHFPVMPYARESRRVIGVTTVTAGQIKRMEMCAGCPKRAQETFKHALAIGDYPVDLHACNENAHLELQFESESDVPAGFISGPFQVPFEAFIPQSVDGLIAAEKNLSVTRLVNGAIRLQPITMLTGQAAGVIAALAVQQGVQPRSVNPFEVQKYLVDHGCRLTVQTFADVPRSHPSWEAVQLVAAREIMIGYSDVDFAITDEQERGWAAAIIARMFDVNSSNPPAVPTFQDVPTDHPAYAWIEGLAAAGLTSGCSAVPKLYCPDDPLTRAALAAFIVNGMGWNVDNAPVQPYYQDLPDAAAHWSFAFVQLVSQHGLKFGCSNNTFCPDEPISRGDIADVVLDILLLLN